MSSNDQLCAVTAASADVRGADGAFAQAAGALNWPGVVVDDMKLFGHRVAVVAEVDVDAHDARMASGWEPVIDRMSVAMWDWPEQRATMPPSAVALRGVLTRGRRWQHALDIAGGFVGFCSTAIVLDQQHTPNQHCLMTAHLRGVGVLQLGRHDVRPELVQAGRVGPVETARPSALSRWVEELLYARLLADDVITSMAR